MNYFFSTYFLFISGYRLASRLLDNGADEILVTTKAACAEEVRKRREQLIKKHEKLGLKKSDLPESLQKDICEPLK